MKEQPWNRCDYCGQFISFEAFENGTASRKLTSHDKAFSAEDYETSHAQCAQFELTEVQVSLESKL